MIFNDDKNKCFYCERPFNVDNHGMGKTIDHIIPLSEYGCNRSINMVYSCLDCNNFKANFTLQDFINRVNSFITKNHNYKTIPPNRFSIIIKNAALLIRYVEEHGEHLYRKLDEPGRKPSIVGLYLKRQKAALKYCALDVHLSVNTNTKRL